MLSIAIALDNQMQRKWQLGTPAAQKSPKETFASEVRDEDWVVAAEAEILSVAAQTMNLAVTTFGG